MSRAALYLVRVGRDACYDRVVFDLNGSDPVGYLVTYVPAATADPSGKTLHVAGRAVLQVVVRAPILGTDQQGHQPWRTPPSPGQDLITPGSIAGWTSLRAVVFAGSFEGQTTIAVGVSHRLPFRVLVTADAHYRHLIIDILH
jgi:hypothetical protein